MQNGPSESGGVSACELMPPANTGRAKPWNHKVIAKQELFSKPLTYSVNRGLSAIDDLNSWEI